MTHKDTFVKTHQPCPNPSCDSTDAYSIRSDGSGFCFSCNKNHYPDGFVRQPDGMKDTPMAASVDIEAGTSLQKVIHETRGINPKTYDFFGVRLRVDSSGDPHSFVFDLPDNRSLNRSAIAKKFWFTGESSGGLPLFGADRFPAGSAKVITITEGYFDTMAVYDMMGSYPVVGVQSASSAKTEAAKAYEYINSFDKIYICFDADEPGQKAADQVARLFDFNKVYLVSLDKELKDPNGYLEAGQEKKFYKTWWAARRFLPSGILASYSDFDQIFDEDIEKPAVPYPFPSLQEMTYGIRSGELVLLTAQEGMGKTEIFRAIEYHLLKTTDSNIGILHLEENKARTLKGYVNYEIRQPVHLPEFALSKEDLKKHLRSATGRDERLHIYSHFGSDDPDVILSTVRFMAGACGCKYIFLDHITMVVSGLQGEDERKALDYISTRLAMMVEELDFTLFLISHVNDEGKTRGSRNIGKVADLRIDMFRDITAENEIVRNTTQLMVSKNRYVGRTGPAGRLFFNTDSYILEEPEEALPEVA